ncbi:hypothetical protein DMN91_011396 [Ooceraea biroi]|uniref:Uncharacterized protein n=1 Tax=Ooceraea biroi TaxID=2015173 RepID=A0A026VYU2_OOCBI|nr:uncharacterized protein LOC105285062 [Ooceraea biroi]EZA48973.1 hypothetical protein X777_12419 [Ooceraea biroi]RLU15642.1 hypothetical protein DMN91_011396 [Ooceraea biroi]
MLHRDSTSRKIRKYNVAKALELITKHRIEAKRKGKDNGKALNDHKVAYYCNSFQDKKKRTTGFSKSIVLLEMQSYIARQDWKHALHLFPKLLECCVELEPLVWRYMFLILLHVNNPLHLQDFFERCVGNRSSNNGALLERLLSLPKEF